MRKSELTREKQRLLWEDISVIFRYNITIPLTYNRYTIGTNYPEAEIRYKIEQPCEGKIDIVITTYEIPGFPNGYEFKDVVNVVIKSSEKDNDQQKYDPDLICEIQGMLVDDEIYAREYAEVIMDKICKKLSITLIKYNDNRYLYQPKVEPLWSKAIFDRSEYTPFVEEKQKAQEKMDESEKKIYLEDHVYMRDSMKCMSIITLPPKDIKINKWLSKEDDVVNFLTNQYYLALGSENIKSKFFHLFAIIEFCEKEYVEYNGASRLLTDAEVEKITGELEKQLDTKKREKIISALKSDLMKLNDIGRVGKLQNILKWMKIEKYGQVGYKKEIDRRLLAEITTLRNKSFHGTKENVAEAEEKYAAAVENLLYIDEMILDFVTKELNKCQE